MILIECLFPTLSPWHLLFHTFISLLCMPFSWCHKEIFLRMGYKFGWFILSRKAVVATTSMALSGGLFHQRNKKSILMRVVELSGGWDLRLDHLWSVILVFCVSETFPFALPLPLRLVQSSGSSSHSLLIRLLLISLSIEINPCAIAYNISLQPWSLSESSFSIKATTLIPYEQWLSPDKN